MFFEFEDNNFEYKVSERSNLVANPHFHSQIEIIKVCDGIGRAYVDGKEWTINAGDIFIVFPNQVHFYKHSGCRFKLIMVSSDICRQLSDAFERFIPRCPVIKKGCCGAAADTALEALFSIDCDGFSKAEKYGYTLIFLSNVLRCTELTKRDVQGNDTVKEIIRYCYDNYTDTVTLGDMATALHISKYYISHIFSRLGTDFSGYINSLRVSKACGLLNEGRLSISEVAYEVGFGSIRSFNRAFLKIKGIPPREYREKKDF